MSQTRVAFQKLEDEVKKDLVEHGGYGANQNYKSLMQSRINLDAIYMRLFRCFQALPIVALRLHPIYRFITATSRIGTCRCELRLRHRRGQAFLPTPSDATGLER